MENESRETPCSHQQRTGHSSAANSLNNIKIVVSGFVCFGDT